MHSSLHQFHTYFHRFVALVAIGAVASAFVLAGCTRGNNDDESPVPDPSTPNVLIAPSAAALGATSVVPVVSAVPVQSVDSLRQPWPDGQPVEQSQWVRDRLATVKQIFGFTQAGEEWIDGYDLRQMVEQPAWFGSHGYGSWAGAGEAVPRSVLHELGHSYWGAFAVDGRPGLSWDRSDGTAPALQAYRDDLDAFLRQPPDRFEPLRDRFRNLPGLNVGEYSDLFHFGEANLLYMTGGNLQLVPPILRKYVSSYVSAGGAGPEGGNYLLASWDIALSWFNSLSADDRRIAGEVFGLQHFPAAPYAHLPEVNFPGDAPDIKVEVRTAFEAEERQRLIDFADQLDGVIDREFSLVDAAGADRGFDFWRSYLSDKLQLHVRYPGLLAGLGSERGTQLSAALDLYRDIQSRSEDQQVQRYRESQNQALVPELAVLLKPRAIVELFAESGSAGGIAAVLGGRAERLTALVEAVERVEAAGDSADGAAELEAFMRSLPEDELRSDMFLLLDLLRSAGTGLAGRVMPALSNDMLLILLRVQPAAARSFEIGPDRLLEAMNVRAGSSLPEISAAAKLLVENSSGNFDIDAAYGEAVFTHFDRFVVSAPGEVLRSVATSGMRIVPWISRSSDGALRAMRSEPNDAAALLLALSGSRETAERIVHLIAGSDPALAADLTVSAANVHGRGEPFLASALSAFAFDAYWSARGAGPNIGPKRFAEFVVALADRLGDAPVEAALTDVIETLMSGAAAGELEPIGVEEFDRTARSALDSVSGDAAVTFGRVLERAVLDK